MAKTQKRKKKNFRLRRSVRRTLGALLMMTAIIVAAIPFPDAAATDTGESGTQEEERVLEAPVYEVEPDDTINIDVELTGNPDFTAYTIKEIDGIWWYEWQFKYFLMENNDSKAIIHSYNQDYKTKDIYLKDTINTGYPYVTETKMEEEFTNHGTITVGFDEYQDERYLYYFPEACKQVEQNLEDGLTSVSVTVTPSEVLKNDIEKKLEYYCEYIFDGGKLAGKGYTMVGVWASKSTINDPTITDNQVKIFIPGEKNIGGGNTVDYSEDENGFLYSIANSHRLFGIGNEALKGVKNVDTLTMSDQIRYIGDSAFENSFVREVTVQNVAEIGNYAFKGCDKLESFNATDALQVIGTEAFYGTKLKSIKLPAVKIGEGAFAKNDDLSLVSFEGGSNIIIGAFAFYDCPSLSSQDLSGVRIVEIGEGAFALSVLDDGTCKDFKFPSELSEITRFGEGILSGRTELKTVTMPASLGRVPTDDGLPENTFDGCKSLEVVTFPESSVYLAFGADFFCEVQNPDFYVTGPAKLAANSENPALPRQSTWSTSMSNDAPVPYVYKIDGKQYYEISNGDYLLLIDDKGTLVSCDFLDTTGDGLPDPTKIPEMVIPDKVANKVISNIAPGCFGESGIETDILDYIEKLIIKDGGNIKEIGNNVFQGAALMKEAYIGDSILKIGDKAFADISNLEKVTIGKNISQIGNGAFENCIALSDVIFKTPDNTATLTKDKIGDNAFTTNSGRLVFTGTIAENYGPFNYAMDPAKYADPEDGIRICYKTGDPSNLTVILDDRNHLPTLMDYPKFDDLDQIIIDTLDEEGNVIEQKNLLQKYQENDVLTPAEEALINATLFVEIPAGVKSIDTRGYLNNTSEQTVNPGQVVTNSMNREIYFSDDTEYPYGDTYTEYGLFNGMIDDRSTVTEAIPRGDDNILSITMHTVEYLPTISNDDLVGMGEEDYTGGAFYSCESLQRVALGSAMQDVGSVPFKDCLSLSEVDAADTQNYVSDNKILYEKVTNVLDDGTTVSGLEIVEVLHTRGLTGDLDVNSMADPLLSDVVSIAPAAFMNTTVGSVDLNGTRSELKIIPEDCFKGSQGLNYTYLPSNIRIILDGAFEDTGINGNIYIYGKEVDVKNDAFRGEDGKTVWTYKDTAAWNSVKDITNITVRPLEDTFRVTFYNSVNGQVIKAVDVEEGEKAEAPEGSEIPKVNGMKFKGWSTDEWKKVTKDLVVMALYESTGSGTGTGGGTGTGDGGTKVPGGVDKDGDGLPDVDENGNKLYTLTVTNGTGGGRYAAGKVVNIQAGAAPDGAGFTHWSSTNKDVIFNDATKPSTSLTMPAADTTVVSNFAGYYRLDVVYGSGSGSYPAGAKVEIQAVDAPQGRSFASWRSSTSALTIENARKQTTTVTMPKSNATVTATYMDNGSISGNSTNKNSQNGTKVIITKPGILNTDKASAYVSGSSDNFIVKISESAEATDAVQKALQAKYPDMTRVRYFAMDISLYDATGTRKITDTTGLKINITLPIPEALREYAGNNKIAAVVNGQIEDLAPKFVTIDGVPCISFTATHFSPYTIYVDTANLTTVSNTLDSTPKTGDGIHPKWFLSIGLASISMILFLKKDKRYTTKLS